jgi:hypothetical protein
MALYKFLSLRINNDNNDQHQHHHHRPIVALTDGDPKAVELLQQNLNHIDNRKALQQPTDDYSNNRQHSYDHGDQNAKIDFRCKATSLQWGEPESLNRFDDWCRREFLAHPPATTGSSSRNSQVADEESEKVSSSSLPPPRHFVFDVIVAGKQQQQLDKTIRSCSCTMQCWTVVFVNDADQS